ncbi:MAG: 2-hydroxyacyl-CoA dehydratase [bacterium]|nr:2-hydroxyacyl-CoA dehydratase [bacterium]
MDRINSALADLEKRVKNNERVIGCFPLYPPLELFHSMGLIPIVLWGLRDRFDAVPESDKHLQNYCCSVSRLLAEFLLTGEREVLDGIFMYNACDTLRNLPEIINEENMLPLFKIHIPAVSWNQGKARDYMKNEINELIGALENQFDIRFSGDRFKESVELFRGMRKLAGEAELLAAQGTVSFNEYSSIIHEGCFRTVEELVEALEQLITEKGPVSGSIETAETGVILSGILPPPASIINEIEGAGLRIVGNDISSMTRSIAYTPEQTASAADYYLDFYENHFPCTTILPSADARIDTVVNLAKERGAGGVIFIGEKFCEYEYLELPLLEKRLREEGIDLLPLEIALDDRENIGAFKTRVEAFAEMKQIGTG